MAVTVLGVFDDALEARRAMENLRDSVYPFEDVSIISRQTENGEPVSSTEDVSAGEGATVGAVWGGLVGLGALLIPGIGPFIAGGALFAAITGAVTGAVVGGVTAALVDFGGIPEAEARQYEQYVHEGKTLIVVKANSTGDASEARRMLSEEGADEVYNAGGEAAETSTASTVSAPRVAMYDNGARVSAPTHQSETSSVSSVPASSGTSTSYAGDTSIDTSADMGLIQPGLGGGVITPRAPGGTEPIVSAPDALPENEDARR